MDGNEIFLPGQRCNAVEQNSQGDDQAGKRSGDPDIEQCAFGLKRRPNADDRTHRPERIEEKRRDRDEIGKRGFHAVILCREVMAKFVRSKPSLFNQNTPATVVVKNVIRKSPMWSAYVFNRARMGLASTVSYCSWP